MYSKQVGGNTAKACTHNARVSVKNTKPVCRAVRGMYLDRAKRFLEDVAKQKRSIGGKYYTKSTLEVLNLIKSAEKNAEFKNLDLDRIYIAHIAALDGTRMLRRRHKRKLGMKLKTAHLEIILKEKGGLERKTKVKERSEKHEEAKETEVKSEKNQKEEKSKEIKEAETNQKLERKEPVKIKDSRSKEQAEKQDKEIKQKTQKKSLKQKTEIKK